MNKYDVTFYGVYFNYKNEFAGANIYPTKELVHALPGFANTFFEVSVIENFEKQKDVLKVKLQNGEIQYLTLNAPYLYWSDIMWKRASNTIIPESFMQAYIRYAMSEKNK